MASVRVHYESPAARSYNIQDAINSLATFMQRTKEVESAELSKKFNSIMLAPKAALWMKLPPQVVLPEDAIKPMSANSANQNQVNQDHNRNQGFNKLAGMPGGLPEDKVPGTSGVKAKEVKAK